MCPTGSSPAVEGAPPLRRTKRRTLTGWYPRAGPPMARRTWWAPRVSSQVRQGPVGTPWASTGTVEAYCPVTATLRTRAPAASGRASSRRVASFTISHHWAASWVVALVGDDHAVVGDEADLGPPGAQVDREAELVAHVAGTWACSSIMSDITARMNSSASLVMPPATPP